MLWYRSADVTTSRFAPRQVFQAGTRLSETRDPNVISGRVSYKISWRSLESCSAKQDGGVLREGIRALSEALMEMEV